MIIEDCKALVSINGKLVLLTENLDAIKELFWKWNIKFPEVSLKPVCVIRVNLFGITFDFEDEEGNKWSKHIYSDHIQSKLIKSNNDGAEVISSMERDSYAYLLKRFGKR